MKKLKNDSGSALILALFLMILVSMIIVSFSNQVANQISSTINLDKDIQEKYDIESNIEECIKDFIKSINLNLENGTYSIGYTKEITKKVKDKKIIMTAKQIKPTNSEDNPIKISSDIKNITFQLDITEGENADIKSSVNVNISEISGTKDNVTCKIGYVVESWRMRS